METWKRVPGFPLYEASDVGRVRSWNRLRRSAVPHVLSQTANRYGYSQVTLCAPDGSHKTRTVHSLVLSAFVGPRPKGAHARHLDGDRANNSVVNLTYGSVSENQLDSVAHGTHSCAARTHCPQGHPYDALNTYIEPRGGRGCRECNRAAVARYRARRAAA